MEKGGYLPQHKKKGMLNKAPKYLGLLPFTATIPINERTKEPRMHNQVINAVVLMKKLIIVIRKPIPKIINSGGRRVMKPK